MISWYRYLQGFRRFLKKRRKHFLFLLSFVFRINKNVAPGTELPYFYLDLQDQPELDQLPVQVTSKQCCRSGSAESVSFPWIRIRIQKLAESGSNKIH